MIENQTIILLHSTQTIFNIITQQTQLNSRHISPDLIGFRQEQFKICKTSNLSDRIYKLSREVSLV